MKYKYLVCLDLPGFHYAGMTKSILISRHYFKFCAVLYKFIAYYWLTKFSKNDCNDYYSLIKITKR